MAAAGPSAPGSRSVPGWRSVPGSPSVLRSVSRSEPASGSERPWASRSAPRSALGGGEADADALALGLGDGSGVTGRARMTTAAPLRSWSWSVAPRGSTRATPPRAARYAVSWAMRSSAQAARVVPSGPIAAIDPLVVYGPVYELQPANPATLSGRRRPSCCCRAVAPRGCSARLAYESTTHDPSNGLDGAARKTSRTEASEPRIVKRVRADVEVATLLEQVEIRRLEGEGRLGAGRAGC